jgi:hypothetical protein
MIAIPELPHTHDHGDGVPIAPGTPISLIELCDAGEDAFGGFKQHTVQPAGPEVGRKMPDGTMQWGGFDQDCLHSVATLAEAHGLWFDCPLCWAKNGGPVGTHGVLVWFAGKPVPDRLGQNSAGVTVRWNVVGGTGLSDLQLAPSILLQGGCGWHGFVGSSGVPPGFAA